MEATTTHTYPFGETPVEVIREQGVQMDYPPGDLIQLRSNLFDIEWGVDDLITVLDALYGVSRMNSDYAVSGAHALRISILAALGIDEGGE